jgi:choline dehydrogenase
VAWGWRADPLTRYLDLDHTEIAAAALDALAATGFPAVEDHNRPGAVGAGRMPMNTRDGVRVTTADAYLPSGRTPPNLTIRGDSGVSSVVFDGTHAVGVRLVDGAVIEAGWVVLCAGTYGSPPILMRSGVGPAAHLREVGLTVTVNLPGVGANLADHPQVAVDCGYTGAARAAPVLHSIATFHSAGRSTRETPDLMLWLADPEEDASFAIEVLLLRPRSRGTVRLRSANPTDPPIIELPHLSDPEDAERLAEGYRRAFAVANRPELRRLCTGPASAEPDDLDALIRAEEYSIPHVVGTCAMGQGPRTAQSSTCPAAYTEPSASVSSTRRSCRTCPRGSPTCRRS